MAEGARFPARRPRRPKRRPSRDKADVDVLGNEATAALVAGSTGALTPDRVDNLQRTVGNNATTQVIQRDRAALKGGKTKPNGGQLLQAVMAPVPGIAAAMSYDKLAGWQKALEIIAYDEDVDAERAKHDADYRRSHNNYAGPIGEDSWRDRDAQIEAKRKFITDKSSLRAPLDMDKLLAPEVLGEQQWNVVAEHKFRGWLREYLASREWAAELTQEAEMVPGYLRETDPKMEALSRGGVPHVRLMWGGNSVIAKNGRVTWDEIKDWPKVKEEYSIQVTGNVSMWELGVKIPYLQTDIAKAVSEHQDLIDRSKAHPVVRWLSEQANVPGPLEMAGALRDAKENPDDPDAQARLFALQLKVAPMPGIDIWAAPREAALAADKYRAEGKYELAAALYAEADRMATVASQRFYTYEDRVMSGAATIVTWLNRAKTVGKMASMFTGAGGVLRTAAVTAGYSFAQEGAEQVVAHWIDPMNKIDIAGLAKQSAIEGLMAVVGGVTQGAFMKAIATRYGTQLVKAGWSVSQARQMMSAGAAMTAGFYNVPARIVLDKIIAGKAVPSSVAEISDMVATEAFRNAAMDVVGGYVHKTGQKPTERPADAPSGGRFTLEDAPVSGRPDDTIVDALVRPDEDVTNVDVATGPPGSKRGAPVRITAEARALAERAEALRPGWAKMSQQERAQRLVDLAYQQVKDTGLHPPHAGLEPGDGAHFSGKQWQVKMGKDALMDNPSDADWAHALDLARHEVQHALDWFRVARQRSADQPSEAPHTIAKELNITNEAAEAAAQVNKNGSGESMAPGSAAASNAEATHESVWGAGRKERNETLTKWEELRDVLAKARDNYVKAEKAADPSGLLRDAAFNDWKRAYDEFQPVDDKYRALPEEIFAYEAGRAANKAVQERALVRAMAKARSDVADAARSLEILIDNRAAAKAGGEKYGVLMPEALQQALAQFRYALQVEANLRPEYDKLVNRTW